MILTPTLFLMCGIRMQPLQGCGVPGQFGLSQRSGDDFSAVLNEPTVCLPCSYVHQQLVPEFGTATANTQVPKCVTEEQTIRSPRVVDQSATDMCNWSTEVGDVRRCHSMVRLVFQQIQLELDALQDGNPVEVILQQVLDVCRHVSGDLTTGARCVSSCVRYAGEAGVAVRQRQREPTQSTGRAGALLQSTDNEHRELSIESDPGRDCR